MADAWIVVNGESFWTFQIKAWRNILVSSVKGRKKLISKFTDVYTSIGFSGQKETKMYDKFKATVPLRLESKKGEWWDINCRWPSSCVKCLRYLTLLSVFTSDERYVTREQGIAVGGQWYGCWPPNNQRDLQRWWKVSFINQWFLYLWKFAAIQRFLKTVVSSYIILFFSIVQFACLKPRLHRLHSLTCKR